MTTAQSKSEALARYFQTPSDGGHQPINDQYDRYITSQPFSSCFQSLLGVRQPEEQSIPRALDTMALRLGQMTAAIPLSDPQRDALSSMLLSQEGDVMVVNGPPGSGKTTLLQSAVAVLFTRAALENKPAPIIFGVSANPQLINDLAASFSLPATPIGGAATPLSTVAQAPVQLELQRPGFTTRWLPAGNKISFGLHLAAQEGSLLDPYLTKQKLHELAHKPGLHLSRRHFMRAFSTAFPSLSDQPLTLAEIQSTLHQQLVAIAEQLNDIQEAAINIQGSFPGLLSDKHYQVKKTRELVAAEGIYNCLSAAHQHGQKQSGPGAFLKSASSLFGGGRQKQGAAISEYISELRGVPEQTLIDLETASKKCIDEGDWKGFTAILHQESTEALSRVRILEGQTEAIESLLTVWTEISQQIGDQPGNMSITECDRLLDTTLRTQAYWLAVHIFEARWIQAMTDSWWASSSGPMTQPKTADEVRQELRMQCMLTPCLITSTQQLPSHLLATEGADGQPQTLWNEIDLLIVDEANQVASEYAGCFTLTKRAMVSGDICQTLPSWSVLEPEDRQRAASLLPGTDWHTLQQQGLTLSGGSLMYMARNATPFRPDPDLGPGIYLSEHRRSVDSIIQYCNQLCYQGKLVSLRPDTDVDRDALGLPAMGWAHIHGRSELTEQGWCNWPEARAVAAWIHHNLDALQKHYHLILPNVLAVITPYQAQVDAIQSELRALDIKNLQVGTPRDFAGLSRPIVLFSSVYTWCNDLAYSFDQGPNFLNVAVSRATDSFLILGDMGIFHPQEDTPSGLLAKHFLASSSNEIDVHPEWAARPDLSAEPSAILLTPDQHKQALEHVFQQATSRIVIVSPWVDQPNAIAESIPLWASAARQRSVNTMVFISAVSDTSLKTPAFQRYFKSLTDVGVTVEIISSVHSTLLFVDGKEMYVGSYNWLSNPSVSKLQRTEQTLHYQSPKVAQELTEIVKGLVVRRKVATATATATAAAKPDKSQEPD